MKKIAIITDSSGDVPENLVKKYNIKIIPTRICFSDKEYIDNKNLKIDIYKLMEKEIPKTSLPQIGDILNIFNQVKTEGYDEAIYIGLSSGLSGTFNAVRCAANEYQGLKIHCFDSRTLACAHGLIIMAAATLIRTTDTISDIFNNLKALRDKMFVLFCVRDLTHLIKGGRIGKVVGAVGNFLKICPVMTVNNDGIFETKIKAIGFNRALNTLINEIKTRFKDIEIVVAVTYSNNKIYAEKILDEIKKCCKIKTSIIEPACLTLGIHIGPDMAGIAVYPV